MIVDWLGALWEWSPVASVAIAVAMVIIVAAQIDVLRLGGAAFAAAGRSRWAWMLLFVGIGPPAVLLYVATVRPHVAHPERFADDVPDADAPDADVPPEGTVDDAPVRSRATA